MATRKGPIQAKSIRSLARQVGRAESTVRKWLARSDWPFELGPPWVVRKVKAWMEIHLKPDSAAAYRKKVAAVEAGSGEFSSMSAYQKARTQAVIERALLLRQRRLVEAGKLHDVAGCRQRRLRQIHEVKGALLALGRSMANSLVGRDADAVETTIHDRCLQICEEFARDGDDDGAT